MIAFTHMGRIGQLGNQMFQYASLKGIAANRGYSYIFPSYADAVVDSLGNHLRTELFEPFLPSGPVGQIQTDKYVQEPHFHFSQDLFDNCPNGVSLMGYFQTPKYFENIEQEIREDFDFRNEIKVPCAEMMETVEDPIALHVRRGDFIINADNHFNQGLEYYEEALKKFDPKRTVVIFSDDTDWCKEQDLFKPDRFLVSEGSNSYTDLCLMSMCSDFIIANSTFSWWGAWLSENEEKQVVYPKQWFGITGYTKDHNVSDMFPKDWIKI